MADNILLEKDSKTINNPKHLQRNVFFSLFTEKIYY